MAVILTEKRWVITTVCVVIGLISLAAALVITVDPYFHYRAPKTDVFRYTLDNQRFQNDGIVRHFDYEALITGSSMCENFKASEVEKLWGYKTIKVTFSGASYRELSRIVQVAAKNQPKLKLAIIGIDQNKLLYPSDWMRTDLGSFPEYLYDDNVLNDSAYWLNTDALRKALGAVWGWGECGITSFDDYSSWHNENTRYGADVVLNGMVLENLPQHPEQEFTEGDRALAAENFRDNFLPIIESVPEVYFFLTPYSEARMELWRKSGMYGRMRAAAAELKRLMSAYPNVRLFDFSDHTEITGKLENYRDLDHYGPWVNSLILQWMREAIAGGY